MATTPYWLDYPYEPRPPLERDIEVDACVIGAGVGGLSCARELARRGVETVVLEARTVASGASGRNGGFLLAGAAPFHIDARERWGRAAARRLYALTVEAQRDLYALAEEIGAADHVRPVGSLRLATSEREAGHVARQVEALREDGFEAHLVGHGELEQPLGRIGHNGCLVPHDGALQPARWIRALAEEAERQGATIYEHTIARPGRPLTANGARIRARHVVIAADGALPGLLPRTRGRVRSRRLHMIASAPLGERVLSTLVYARYGYEYFQQLPDGRIALGGFSDLDGDDSYTEREEGSAKVWKRLARYLRGDLGLDAEVTHRWVGIVGFSDGDRPLAGEIEEGLYALGGYSGHGNLIGFVAGRGVAEAIACGASEALEILALA